MWRTEKDISLSRNAYENIGKVGVLPRGIDFETATGGLGVLFSPKIYYSKYLCPAGIFPLL